eukprot:1047151-Rhodomonas_salina.1
MAVPHTASCIPSSPRSSSLSCSVLSFALSLSLSVSSSCFLSVQSLSVRNRGSEVEVSAWGDSRGSMGRGREGL